MRRLIPLLLAVVACTGAAEDTTTTAPLAQPSTTTTTAATSTTTTTEATTTTTENECVDRIGDGVLRTRRGFVCPPTMDIFGGEAIQDPSVSKLYLPGTYVTRHLSPKLAFTRTARFRSVGEGPGESVDLDSQPAGSDQPQRIRFAQVFVADLAAGFRDTSWEDVEWLFELETAETEFASFPATRIDFTVTGEGCGSDAAPVCLVEFANGRSWGYNFPQHIRLLTFEVAGEPLAIHVQAHPDDFDAYWTDTVRPILDSIQFLDP